MAFYSHDPDRDYRIRIEFRLGLLRRLESVSVLAAVLVCSLTYALWNSYDLDVRTLALLGGPAALAASVLVGREQSTLGSRLRLRSTSILAGSLVGRQVHGTAEIGRAAHVVGETESLITRPVTAAR